MRVVNRPTATKVANVIRLLMCLPAGCAACRPVVSGATDASVTISAARVPGVDAGWPLTEAKVDAWLSYQRKVRAKVEVGAVQFSVTELARHEHAVRADAGLSEEEVDHIEDVVAAVVTSRNVSKLTGVEALREFERVAASLPETQRSQVDLAMRELRTKAQRAASLEPEKARFGVEAVGAVLAREAEVTAMWDALVEAKEARSFQK